MPLRTSLKQMMFYVIILVVLSPFSASYADPIPTTNSMINIEVTTASPVCDPKCGCDGLYIYNETKDECVLNLEKLMTTIMVRYDNHDDEDLLAKDSMERSIYIEGQKLFRGIMISVILFMTCAAICVVSACLYCCRINYSDRKLKNQIKELAKKIHYDTKKAPSKVKTEEPKAQSCNVVVAQAGVYVV